MKKNQSTSQLDELRKNNPPEHYVRGGSHIQSALSPPTSSSSMIVTSSTSLTEGFEIPSFDSNILDSNEDLMCGFIGSPPNRNSKELSSIEEEEDDTYEDELVQKREDSNDDEELKNRELLWHQNVAPDSESKDLLEGKDEKKLDEEGLLFTRDKSGAIVVRGGTLEKLVEVLTDPRATVDCFYIQAFLLTYKRFASTEHLNKFLLCRFFPEEEKSNPFTQEFKTKVLDPIRFRTINVFKKWIQLIQCDPILDMEVVDTLLKSLETIHTNSAEFDNFVLTMKENLVKKKQNHSESDVIEAEPKTPDLLKAPKPRLGQTLRDVTSYKDIKLLDIQPIELARQLTLLEHSLFCAIRSSELENQNWAKDRAPYIKNLTDHFNIISIWPTTEVVKLANIRKRVAVIEFFIQTALECLNLQNFNGVMEIITGLSVVPVCRLKSTWEKISGAAKKTFTELEELLSSHKSFKNLREASRKAQRPCVHYIGLYLSDLVFLEDGNPDLIEPEGYINFEKFRMLASVSNFIHQAQQGKYTLIPVPTIQEYIKNLSVISQEEAYEHSYKILPRGSQKELEEDMSPKPKMPESPQSNFQKQFKNKVNTNGPFMLYVSSNLKMAVSKLPFLEEQSTLRDNQLMRQLQKELHLILNHKFPSGFQLTKWKKEDKEASIYEWPSEINMTLISCGDGSGPGRATHALETRLTADSVEVSSFLRKVRFYTEVTYNLVRPILVVAGVEEGIHNLAEKYGVDLIIFPTTFNLTTGKKNLSTTF
eukprot:TRINITY_DN1414_c0_g1_i1.p1 TRINITY_DN1414_c0_g1~~TRINITY_DN1414_c0_g1_i1.p1  ORF type:complete len:890 (+),score=209.18 TRINITY_DN1414_c0_g1_i1:382-2670(+)